MSAGGEVRSQSSRLRDPGGERPPTFHVAAKILLSGHEEQEAVTFHAGNRLGGNAITEIIVSGRVAAQAINADNK